MEDIMQKNPEIFKKLGFDNTIQWIFYDEPVEQFLRFLADNITEDNLLTEKEVLEIEVLQNRGQYISGNELKIKSCQLENDFPGLFTCSENDVKELEEDIDSLKEASTSFSTLIEDMKVTKQRMNVEVCSLESDVNVLTKTEQHFKTACLGKAKQLEELQLDNAKLNQEANLCFTKLQSPPLFMSQLPVEQYGRKCDSFVQYFNQYLLEHYKLQTSVPSDSDEVDMHVVKELQKLQESFERYMCEYIRESEQSVATQSMLERLDLKQIHVSCLTDLARETRELELQNQHLCAMHDTLTNDVLFHVQDLARQKMELVLYENTKLKLSRAKERHENDRKLLSIIGDAVSNAELLWIAIQLDLERCRKRSDSSEQMKQETVAAMQRLKIMRNLHNNDATNMFLNQLAAMLSQHLGQEVRPEAKACLYEYEKFNRLLNHNMQNLPSDKNYFQVLAQIKEMNQMKENLHQLVFDGPVATPMLEPIRFLKPIHNAKMNLKSLGKKLRLLRSLFRENISERFAHDKLWRYSQQLWMWFITEPEHVLMAIEEAKKAAAKSLSYKGAKPLAGIKRKE